MREWGNAMDKKEVIAFFDTLAGAWDDMQVRNEAVISRILDLGGICQGADVLDIACGTGVLFPDYLGRNVKSVTGIDISSEMVNIAREKFPQVEVICDDAQSYDFAKKFDAVMIYNAFPHFGEPDKLFANLYVNLKENGRLTVAHGISEKELAECHSGKAKNVSLPLPSKEKLADMMSELFSVDVMISDEEKYIVSGVKR